MHKNLEKLHYADKIYTKLINVDRQKTLGADQELRLSASQRRQAREKRRNIDPIHDHVLI